MENAMKEQSTEVPVSPNVTPPCSLVLKDGQEFVPSTEDLQLWAKTYPGIDVENQLLRMSAWLLANRAKRKTARGIRRFVVGWLELGLLSRASLRGCLCIMVVASSVIFWF